jgi:hypothetical protein
LAITASRSTSFTTQTCSDDQKFSHLARSAFCAARQYLVKSARRTPDTASPILARRIERAQALVMRTRHTV